MTSNKIRWGIIGCGAVTEVKSGPAYQQTPGFELAAVMRRDTALAHDYAKRHGVGLVYADADKLISSGDIDAIYIATPPDSHKEYALKVAKAGKICCIEKPLAPNFEDSLEISNAFKANNIPLFVAYYRRSLPRFKKVQQLMEEGAIGNVRHVSWHLNKAVSDLDLSQQYNWRTDKNVARGGYFDDLASHGLDLFGFLFGDYLQVKGVGVNQQGLYSAFDSLTASWLHKNGITGSGSWNFGSFKRQDDVIIYGSKGQMSFSVFDEQPIELDGTSGKQTIKIDNPFHIQKYHVENMAKTIIGKDTHPSTGETATHTSWVMEQILSGEQ